MVVYAFDVDETLEVSKGPVKLYDLVKLRERGDIVGLCGNWATVTLHCPDWHRICSFVGPCGIEKHDFLRQLRQYIPGHDYVMVGTSSAFPVRATTVALRSEQAGGSFKKASSPKGCAEWVPYLSLREMLPCLRPFPADCAFREVS